MSKSYKRWSKSEKLTILREAEQAGVVQTCRKFDVSSATFYHWKKVYDAQGEAGFSETKSPANKKYKNLEEENRRLKKLLVDKDLALESQKELLKKKVWNRRCKKDLVDKLADKFQVSKLQVMKHVGLSPSVYYYQEKPGRKGCLPSKQTLHEEHGKVANESVVEQIEKILSEPFQDYWGYHNITAELRELGYLINHKKVYRLMKEEKLLKPSARLKPEQVARKFVRFRKVVTEKPLECVEMDIKCVWIPERGKQAYLLTLLDVHTRKVLAHQFAWNMKKDQVINLYADLIDQGQLPEGTIIRSDNGSQFLAGKVREYLAMVGLEQEFTHVATPEENGHVEAYHGILKRELFNRFEYRSFLEAYELINQFVHYYNYRRRHGSIKRMTPMQKWSQEEHLIATKNKAA